MPKTSDAALAAFIARKGEIDAVLDRIRAASDDHFFASPEDVNWGHVTALAEPRRVCRRLQLLSRMEHHEQDDEQVFP